MEFELEQLMVVKVGTSTLSEVTEGRTECLDTKSFKRIGTQVLDLVDHGSKVVIVTSAAVTAGMVETGVSERPSDVVEQQRLASIGGRFVLNAWAQALPGRNTPEILLTKNELSRSGERHELAAVLRRMFAHGDVPIVNENDVIANAEIRVGDNDRLAAHLASRVKESALFGANIGLILLSDIDGVLRDVGDPESRIEIIPDMDEYRHLASDARSPGGTGGMKTKFKAAKIAQKAGVPMWIAHGRTDDAIRRAMAGEIGTYFPAHAIKGHK